ncbi:MAG: GTP pyrophosphokinase family protein [Clostridia bacterium]
MSPRTDIIVQNNKIDNTEDEKIDIESKQYNDLLKIYEIAMNQVTDTMNGIKARINNMYGYTIIEKVDSRLKSKKSILNKLKKKNIAPTYKALVDNIDDIAGVRIVCPLKDDIFLIKQIIENMPNLKIIQEKDYIYNPKKSGYSAYHLIVETPVTINSETVIIKVEIQIRTVAMDFWSEMEHDIRYKTNNQVSKLDSKKLTWYAKALENLQAKIIKLYRKQENNSMFNY